MIRPSIHHPAWVFIGNGNGDGDEDGDGWGCDGETHAKGGFGFRFTCSSVRISPANSALQCSSGDTPGIFLSVSSRRCDCLSFQIAKAEVLRSSGARAARNFISALLWFS